MKKRRTGAGLTALPRGVLSRLLLAVVLSYGAGCGDREMPGSARPPTAFERVGSIRAAELDEISGIVPAPGGGYIVHNDDGPPRVFVVAPDGALRARIDIENAHLRDWEDLTVLPGPDGDLVAIADFGDNLQRRKSIRLYFIALPAPDGSGAYPSRTPVVHDLRLRYPDGPRDAESLAYDAAGKRLLVLSKRDQPPRLYGIGADTALSQAEATLEFIGEVTTLRPPAPADLLRDPLRGAWVSQPTGMDLSADGHRAAVITYRSLYLFERQDGEDWGAAFGRQPIEIQGPPGTHEEAVMFERAGNAVVVTTEGLPAPLFRLAVPAASQPVSTP